jgi:2-amino-4-hydroxy-6-hydroxymethyldihydropteridine diphosphokinase
VEIILSLGSNLGDRRANLVAAHDALAALAGTHIVVRAPIYETEPLDGPAGTGRMLYLNTVLILESRLEPETFSAAMHAIEARLGRVRGPERHAPRPIDIDLVAFGDIRRDTPTLRLPHPEAAHRRFVLQPLADVRPDLRLPGQSRTVRGLLATLPPTPAVALAGEQWGW